MRKEHFFICYNLQITILIYVENVDTFQIIYQPRLETVRSSVVVSTFKELLIYFVLIRYNNKNIIIFWVNTFRFLTDSRLNMLSSYFKQNNVVQYT